MQLKIVWHDLQNSAKNNNNKKQQQKKEIQKKLSM